VDPATLVEGLAVRRRDVAPHLKRRAELRDNGYVIADNFFAPVEVDLAAVLAAALETPLWGANG
jgi:hypothetical protein